MTFYTEKASRNAYIPGRDVLVDEVMHQWRDQFSSEKSVSICVSTFNVNGRQAPSHIPQWLNSSADIFVVGLQEMDLSVGTYIMENNVKEKMWLSTMINSIPKDRGKYEVVALNRLVGILIVVLARQGLPVNISDVHTSFVATGVQVLLNKLGNKGGVAVSLLLNSTRLCLINSHLAAGDEAISRRNDDYREISQLIFPNSLSIFDHDAVIWLGDLNYRINAQVNGLSNEDVRRIALSNEKAKLVRFDQLKEEQSYGRVFVGFKEGEILFPPTYKYDIGTNNWDSSEKARSPAWCDRVLWWTCDDDVRIEQKTYESLQDITLSDHKPVRSEFIIHARTINQRAADDLYKRAMQEADRRANELLPQISLSCSDLSFGDVFFMDPVTMTIHLRNIGKSIVRLKSRLAHLSFGFEGLRSSVVAHGKLEVIANGEGELPSTLYQTEAVCTHVMGCDVPECRRLRFKERPGKGVCADWLKVAPLQQHLSVGQEVDVCVTVTVDKRSSWLLEGQGEVLNDILVLSLEHGRDYFIPVSARYQHRVFGVSLARLNQLHPAKEEMLIQLDDEFQSELLPVARPVYTLVSSLRRFDLSQQNFGGFVDQSKFSMIRKALENDSPRDLSTLPGISFFSIYSALIRVVDSLKDPLVPIDRRQEWLIACQDASRLWLLIDQFPIGEQRMIVFLTDFLRELIHANPNSRDQVEVWADVLVRESSSSAPSIPRVLALKSIVDYSRDTAIFHSR